MVHGLGAERVVWRTHGLSLLDRLRDEPWAGSPRRAITTRVGGDRLLTPHSTTLASVTPNRFITRRCSRSSSSARSPLMASIRPPGRSNGTLQRASLSREATARDVTASHPPA